jgi:hypothetical protein
MENLNTNKIQGVLQTEHRKGEGKTVDISGIFTLCIGGFIINRKFQKHPKRSTTYCSLLHTFMDTLTYYYYYYCEIIKDAVVLKQTSAECDGQRVKLMMFR